MREIKFRAWNGGQMLKNIPIEAVTLAGDLDFYGTSLHLMQYTGLKDKNGKEIYEGDIVKYKRINGKEIIAEIEWRGEDGCYYYFNHKEPVDSDVSNKESTFFIATTITEIIGNIYENPELIKS